MKKFSAGILVTAWLDVPVDGDTMEEALESARSLGFGKLVKTYPAVRGINDLKVSVVGVSAYDIPGLD